MIEVNSVEVVANFGLVLTFNNGERRRFDMRPYLHFPVFRRLENPGYFSLARVDYGTVTWPGEIDMAPETLYECSVPLTTDQQLSTQPIQRDLPPVTAQARESRQLPHDRYRDQPE